MTRILRTLALLVFLVGCREPVPDLDVGGTSGVYVATEAAPPAPVKGDPVTLVGGIDGSGSGKPLRGWCFGTLRTLLASARPGDVVEARMIGASAYDPTLRVATLRIPVTEAASAFDLRKRLAAAHDGTADSLRKQALASLAAATEGPTTPRTDIWGFLGAAREMLESGGKNARRVLLVCTDGEDTAGEPLTLDLSGIEVVFLLGAGSGDTSAEIIERREVWRTALEARGARVRFVAPGADVQLDELRASTQGEEQ